MIAQFTSSYDHKGYLTVFDVDQKIIDKETKRITDELKDKKVVGKDFDEQLKEELSKIQSVKTKMIKLDWKDELALSNIDALKEELINIVRKKRDSGKDSFELTPEKANKMHDDRAYTSAMLGYALMEERRKNITERKKPNTSNILDKFVIRQGHRMKMI